MPPKMTPGTLHNMVLNASRDTVHGHKVLPGLIAMMLEGDKWQRLVRPIDGQEFRNATIEEWVTGEPWAGLGYPGWLELYAILELSKEGEDVVAELVVRGAPANPRAEAVPTAGPSSLHRDVGTNLVPISKGGTDRKIARLKRDRPDLVERVLLPKTDPRHLSAHAAGKEAGFVKPTLTVPADIPGLASALKRRYTTTELSQLFELIFPRDNQ